MHCRAFLRQLAAAAGDSGDLALEAVHFVTDSATKQSLEAELLELRVSKPTSI
jgi:hypothetical protein